MDTHEGFRLPQGLAEKLNTAAKKSLQPKGAIIRAALADFLGRNKTAASVFVAVEKFEETKK